VYRALAGYSDNWGNPNTWRASASYVTGAHNMKVGYQGSYLIPTPGRAKPTLLSYTFNQGQPASFTMNIPEWLTADRTKIAAFFLQDSWTRGRLTLQGAVRYDRAWSFAPAEHNGTTVTSRVNNAAITLPFTKSVDAYNDITPRFGVAYDCSVTARRPSSSTWATISTPRPTTGPTRATARPPTSCER
jgi:hypothetical protein